VDGKLHYDSVCQSEELGLFQSFLPSKNFAEETILATYANIVDERKPEPIEEKLPLAYRVAFGALNVLFFPPALAIGLVLTPFLGIGMIYSNAYGTCGKCECKYSEHFISYFETREIQLKIIDDKIESEIDCTKSGAELKNNFLIQLRQNQQTLLQEKEQIELANSVFAVFLKHRSIAEYNDAYEQHLDELIRMKKITEQCEGTPVHELEEKKASHQRLKEFIDNGNTLAGIKGHEITPALIEKMVEQLYELPNFGKTIKDKLLCKKYFTEAMMNNLQNQKLHAPIIKSQTVENLLKTCSSTYNQLQWFFK